MPQTTRHQSDLLCPPMSRLANAPIFFPPPPVFRQLSPCAVSPTLGPRGETPHETCVCAGNGMGASGAEGKGGPPPFFFKPHGVAFFQALAVPPGRCYMSRVTADAVRW